MVDYEDLEPMGNWSDSLREQLIDRKTGSQNYDSIVLTPDDAYLIEQRRTWYFRPISKTAYTYNILLLIRQYYFEIKNCYLLFTDWRCRSMTELT